MNPRPRYVWPAAMILLLSTARADERLKGIACRSVHLNFPAGEGAAFYNEIRVDQSAVGTYFCVCGWNKGYYGIQELGNGKKLLIFSVWDSEQDDPKAVQDDRRVKLLHKDEKMRIGRFGGEGTGGQSFYDFDWKNGETYRFLVTAMVNGERTEYAGHFYHPGEKKWKHLVTFSTITGGKLMRGYYSFVEDFKRDRVSATKVRKAHYGNGWVKTTIGEWQPLTKAGFTADSNPVENINAGVDGERFFLTTGGDTKNDQTKLNKSMSLPASVKPERPADLPAIPSEDNGKQQDSGKKSASATPPPGKSPDKTPSDDAPKVTAVPAALRDSLKLDPFYQKYVDLKGYPILASAKVSDAALLEARFLIRQMLAKRDDVLAALVEAKCRFTVMAPDEMTTDVPEQRKMSPKDYWDKRARGLGGRITSSGEENLLNLKGDRYHNENILIHEFAHCIHQQGLRAVDPTFNRKLREIFERAIKNGLWKDTYAATNPGEYWAEGVQDYFDCNAPPRSGVHNDVNTREELAKYDPDLHKLADEVFKQSPFRYTRYDARSGEKARLAAPGD